MLLWFSNIELGDHVSTRYKRAYSPDDFRIDEKFKEECDKRAIAHKITIEIAKFDKISKNIYPLKQTG